MKPGTVDKNGINMIRNQLNLILAYFKDVNEHQMRGASLFFVIASASFSYDVKLIDLSSLTPLSSIQGYDGESRDPGIIKGIQNIIATLDEISQT